MRRLAAHPAIAAMLRMLSVDPKQYALLLGLFSKLSERQEFEAGNARLSMKILVGTFAALSGLFNLIIAFVARPPAASYVFGNFVFASFLLLLILTMEAINTFFNPVEASVLAHQPIRDKTYIAARVTYLASLVASVVLPISIVPALAGWTLNQAPGVYPVSYLVSVYLLGVVVALLGCGVLGLLFRVLPLSRIRNTVLWLQVGFFIFMGGGGRLVEVIFRNSGIRLDVVRWAALPINWFVPLALIGRGNTPSLLAWQSAASMIVCALLVCFGIHSLSEGYLTRVHVLLRSDASRRQVGGGGLGLFIRMITGKPSGRGAFAFVYAMARTDWQFRRAVYPALIQIAILPLAGLARSGLGRSPFIGGSPTAGHFLPHLSGIVGLFICFAIKYSNQHKAAWIFLTFPLTGMRSFVRGIFWSIWLPVSAVPVILLPLWVWRWGLVDGVLLAAYSLAVGSFYLSLEMFLVDGLPFANPPESMKGSMTAPLVIAAALGALIIVGLQWVFIFRSRLVVAGAAAVFAVAAAAIARTSLRYLETNVLHNLHVIATGRTAMFREVG
jgi:hypothetical protein